MRQPTLFEAGDPAPEDSIEPLPPDQPARDFAVDPSHHVVLEASAGTGKTRVLVDRYVRLITAGVDPRHILAITFTRKAAAEMRDRVLAELERRASAGTLPADQWQAIRGRLARIEIATIDAFCFSLLREFPLEADVDPAFDIADETEMGRFSNEALDLAFRIARPLVATDEHLRLLFVRVKPPVLRESLAALLDRRHVASPAVQRFVAAHANVGSMAEVCERFAGLLREPLSRPATLAALVDEGPRGAREFEPLATDLQRIGELSGADPSRLRAFRIRLERHFLTRDGKPRQKLAKPYVASHFASVAARRRHEQTVAAVAPHLKAAFDRFDADLDVLLARGLARMLAITIGQYNRLLEEHALLDFAGMLDRAVALLERQEEFARSRLKLQSRYHHLLIDEFQDTSRRQWRLVELLIDAWAEGEGAADTSTSIFIVGDRKQSIYRFRDAEVTLFDEAAKRIGLLRPDTDVRRAITTSFRAVPELLSFVNALAGSLGGDATLPDRWRYDSLDRFPVAGAARGARRDGEPVLGLIAQPSLADAAEAVAQEVTRLIGHTAVRDRTAGARQARPDDIAILFRTRAGHRVFESALEARGVRTYVYKGLGFFDSPEVQDLQAVIRYLARPDSALRTAELLRSRLARITDDSLARVAADSPRLLLDRSIDIRQRGLAATDVAVLEQLRAAIPRWLTLADRVPPSELIDIVLRDSAYAAELKGRRLDQARENVKKVRSLVRRVENRGYTTLARLAAYFETLRLGDDSNAIVEAAGAVNLMTIHAAKGLEFPVVFVVNLHMAGRGRSAGVSVIDRGPEGEPVVSFGSTEATRLEEARDAEELRRLMYVASTRPRDRLYLAAEVDARGQMRRAPRSLASLLPSSLVDLFAQAAAAPGDRTAVTWTSAEGSFDFAICRPSPPTEPPAELAPETSSLQPLHDLAPIGLRIVTTTDGSASVPPPDRMSAPASGVAAPVLEAPGAVATAAAEVPSEDRAGDGRLVGVLVHRLLAASLDAGGTADPASLVERFMSGDERVDIDDADQLGRTALDYYRRLRHDPELGAILGSGEVLFEVPFSFVRADQPGECVRGVIDCLVLSAGRATVVEIKTGRPRPEHERQIELYRRAAGQIFPERTIETRLYYSSP